MNSQVHLIIILMLTTALTQAYSAFREHFSGVDEYRKQVTELKEQVRRKDLERAIVAQQMAEFQQHVGEILPEAIKDRGQGEKGYPLRSLASVVVRPQSDEMREKLIETFFLQGKKRFSQGEYRQANRIFRKVINDYSYSVHIVESYFLLSEGLFQMRQFKQCAETVERMVELFPESELTGFALIRLGQVFEYQRRSDEAVEIYQTVLRSYPYRDVATQAVQSLKAVAP